ncbi:MAG: sulfotransferase domain-containing protein [Saprospiraceae bacterium]|nr:sulfotransferase domain-containing protein [Saprospiraceae bacterium]
MISTYGKSGTTWMQQIVSQLIFNGETGLPVADMSPWIDLRVPPIPVKMGMVESQTHRRFLKTHLPVDALNFSPKAKYIYMARDGRDVLWSLHNHHSTANEGWYDTLNNTPGLVDPPIGKPEGDIKEYFHNWLNNDGYPFWSMWENVKSWWEISELPNVHFVHFANLKKDMAGEIRKVAAFLDIPIDESKWEDILEHCSFNYMKENATASVPLGGIFWEGGAKTFIHKGKNGRWRDFLSEEESQNYERIAEEKLGTACAHWLKTGEMI